jgi:pyruvate dehydrogenase (quinone)
MLGLKGLTVAEPQAVAPAWDEVLAAQCPVVVEAIVDANVPMLPPHITLEQAKGYLKAVMKGDADSLGIIKASMKEILA